MGKKRIMKDKYILCDKFFYELSQRLYPFYETIGVMDTNYHKYKSRYLIPFGSDYQMSRFSMPMLSFRMSDHWNWMPNEKIYFDSEIENNVTQRYCIDMPPAKLRKCSDKATKPQFGILVAIMDSKGIYRCVYGDKYWPKTHSWSWLEANPEDVIKKWLS